MAHSKLWDGEASYLLRMGPPGLSQGMGHLENRSKIKATGKSRKSRSSNVEEVKTHKIIHVCICRYANYYQLKMRVNIFLPEGTGTK